MDWITDSIAIGNYLEAQDVALLRQESISSILGLVNTLEGRDPEELGVKRIEVVPLEDGAGNDVRLFRGAVDALARLVHEAPPVLVHCVLGRSRSAVVVAAHLMNTLGIDAEGALARIAARRSISVAAKLRPFLDGIA